MIMCLLLIVFNQASSDILFNKKDKWQMMMI